MLRAAWRSLWHHKLRLVLSDPGHRPERRLRRGHASSSATTLNTTFTDLFAQTTTDVVVSPETEVEGSGSRRRGPDAPRRACWPRLQQVPGAAKAGGAVFADGVGHHRLRRRADRPARGPQFGSNWSDDEQLTPVPAHRRRRPHAPGAGRRSTPSPPRPASSSVGDTVDAGHPDRQHRGRAGRHLPLRHQRQPRRGHHRRLRHRHGPAAAAQGPRTSTPRSTSVADEGVSQDTSWPTRIRQVVGPDVKVQTGEEAADEAAPEITEALGLLQHHLAGLRAHRPVRGCVPHRQHLLDADLPAHPRAGAAASRRCHPRAR